jgi:acetyl-CoA C-acetyltransferase/acetyl-CoA acyltransferase
MRKVAVLGTGHTKFMFNSPKTQIEMLAEASMDAIVGSSLKPRDIQAIFCGNALGDFEEGQGMVQSYFADDIGCSNVPANKYEGACASATMAIKDAFMLVGAGFYDIVLACGVEKTTVMGTPLATRTFAMFGESRYEYPAGFTFPGAFAMLAHLYSKQYEIPLARLKEQMALVSVQSHHYGKKNPNAQFRKEITVDQVLNGPMITSPLQLLDCCPFSDGAAAIVMASEDVAKKLVPKPVYIVGAGQASSGMLSSQYRFLPRLRAREIAVGQAYEMAGLQPGDIDVCELHDCFSIASIIAVEALGFAEFGKGGRLWEENQAGIGGRIPINLSGGLKAKGHPIGATGASQVCEIVCQLRGEQADQDRQVEGAGIGLVDTLGGDGTVINLILRTA